MKTKILFIINPTAGVKSKKKSDQYIEKYIDKSKFDYEFAFTEWAGHATIIARDAVANKFDAIVAIGGDGTIREVAKSMLNTNVALGIIPGGSGNGFADHFHIPKKYEEAMAVINQFNCINVDTGSVNDEIFTHASGVGFDAQVSQQFHENMVRGLLSYIKVALFEYVHYTSQKYTLEFDGKSVTVKAFLIAFANVREYGNGFSISPEASATDGLIDIVIGKTFLPIAVPGILYKSQRHILQTSKYIEIIRTKEVRIIRDSKDPVQFDGDSRIMDTELIVKVNPLSLKLIVPDISGKY